MKVKIQLTINSLNFTIHIKYNDKKYNQILDFYLIIIKFY